MSYDNRHRSTLPPKGPVLGIDLDGPCSAYDWYRDKELAKGRSMYHICRDLDAFKDLPVVDGAIESVTKLDKYFEIYFVSTPMHCQPQSYTDKYVWLLKHFGKIAKKKLILTHNKGLFIGDYLVDDRYANGVEDFKGEHILFGGTEFPHWRHVEDYLMNKYTTWKMTRGVFK